MTRLHFHFPITLQGIKIRIISLRGRKNSPAELEADKTFRSQSLLEIWTREDLSNAKGWSLSKRNRFQRDTMIH